MSTSLSSHLFLGVPQVSILCSLSTFPTSLVLCGQLHHFCVATHCNQLISASCALFPCSFAVTTLCMHKFLLAPLMFCNQCFCLVLLCSTSTLHLTLWLLHGATAHQCSQECHLLLCTWSTFKHHASYHTTPILYTHHHLDLSHVELQLPLNCGLAHPLHIV